MPDLSKPDLSKTSVGYLGGLGGQPVDFAKSVIYDRAGLPLDADERKGLTYTHGSAEGKDVPRLPAVFPPAVFPEGQKLYSAQDYLNLIAATPPEFIPTPAEILSAQKEAAEAQSRADAAQAQAEVAEHTAEQSVAAAEAGNDRAV